MDKKSKILIIVFLVLILASVSITFYRIVIKKNYVIEAQVDCDPAAEACFIWECDPESDVEGEACTDNPEENIWYYKIAKRSASRIPLCDPSQDEGCAPMICEPGEKNCGEMLCNEISAQEQGVSCNDPEEYLTNNPPEEEEEETEEECEEGDEACAAVDAEDTACDNGSSEECQESETVLDGEEETGGEPEEDLVVPQENPI